MGVVRSFAAACGFLRSGNSLGITRTRDFVIFLSIFAVRTGNVVVRTAKVVVRTAKVSIRTAEVTMRTAEVAVPAAEVGVRKSKVVARIAKVAVRTAKVAVRTAKVAVRTPKVGALLQKYRRARRERLAAPQCGKACLSARVKSFSRLCLRTPEAEPPQ